jgi:hypothetical protein
LVDAIRLIVIFVVCPTSEQSNLILRVLKPLIIIILFLLLWGAICGRCSGSKLGGALCESFFDLVFTWTFSRWTEI